MRTGYDKTEWLCLFAICAGITVPPFLFGRDWVLGASMTIIFPASFYLVRHMFRQRG